MISNELYELEFSTLRQIFHSFSRSCRNYCILRQDHLNSLEIGESAFLEYKKRNRNFRWLNLNLHYPATGVEVGVFQKWLKRSFPTTHARVMPAIRSKI